MKLEYFHLIDRIVDLDIGEKKIVVEAQVPQHSTIFEGHFPGYPLMPGVLLIECMAQTCGWLGLARNGPTGRPFFAGVKEAKFRTTVLPGDELEFNGRIIHDGSGFAVSGCEGRRQGKAVCEAELTFRVVPFPPPAFRGSVFAWGERIGVPVKELVR